MVRQELDQTIKDLGLYLRERRLVVFFGAGASVASGLPTGDNLLRELGYENHDDEIQLVREDDSFYRKLKKLFSDKKPNDIHKLLALLRARYYITTNYDQLFEQAMGRLYDPETSGFQFGWVVRTDDLSDVSRQRSTLIKLHGDIEDRNSLVAAKHDYAEHLRSPSLVDQLVNVTLSTHPVVFVGYSISDINLIHLLSRRSEWKSGVVPARYAIVVNNSEDELRREEEKMRKLGVEPISLNCSDESKYTETVEELLARLWEQTEDFGIFTKTLEQRKRWTPDALWDQASSCYRDGDFGSAKTWMQRLEVEVTDWRQYISLFGVYLYFSVKLYDKMEKWETLMEQQKVRLKTHFDQVCKVLPSKTWKTLLARYNAGVSLPFYRIGALDDALKAIDEALEVSPSDTADKEAQALFADWYTIRSLIHLSMWARADEADRKEVALKAKRDLEVAKGLLGDHGGLGTEEETHYCGRFYGVSAFLLMAEHDSNGVGDPPDSVARSKLTEMARKAHDHPRRVPYGRLAGLYCAGYSHYWLALRCSEDPARRKADLEESMSLLQEAGKAIEVLSPMVEVKIDFLKWAVKECLRGAPQMGWDIHKKTYKSGLAKLSSCSKSLAEEIDRSEKGLDAWLRTPLN